MLKEENKMLKQDKDYEEKLYLSEHVPFCNLVLALKFLTEKYWIYR